MIRQPIVTVLGHIDHGKTSILDKIRGTTIAEKEAGRITQHIGATEIPIGVIRNVCGDLLKSLPIEIKIPGLLFIDTPGHSAFSSLRERGGSISDLAVLVVDVNEGFKDQTMESLQILKQFKVPFIVAANKIDLVDGWMPTNQYCFMKALSNQREDVVELLDQKLYNIVYELSKFGFDAERFDRVDDYTKSIAVVPLSAKTGEGIAELLMLLVGLSQRYLENNLKIEVDGSGRGSIIEVKEEPGLGKTLDTILYDGIIHVGDQIVVATPDEPIVTKVRALLKPAPLRELREKSKFERIKEVHAAAGIKIAAPNIDNCISGMPIAVANTKEDVATIKDEFKKYIGSIIFSSDSNGVVVKADSLGSLEAIVGILKSKGIPVKRADVGDVTRNDIIIASSNEDLMKVVLSFNVKLSKELQTLARDMGVVLFSSNIIYTLIENYESWVTEQRELEKMNKLASVTLPGKIRILPGYVFRQSKPAVVGVEVLGGEIRNGYHLMREDGKVIGKVKEIQAEGENAGRAVKNQAVAVSIPEATVGRQIKEDMILYTNLSQNDFRKLKELRDLLSNEQIEILKEIIEIKRKENPLWGV